MVTQPTLEAAFREHRGTALEAFALDTGGLPGLQARDTARFSLGADIELSDETVSSVEAQIRRAREGLDGTSTGRRRSVTERRLRYQLTVEIVTKSGHLRVMDEKLEALRADWTPRGSRNAFIERLPDHNRIRLRMEKQGHPTYEDLGQDRTVASKPLYAPHYPHITALKEEMSRWRFYFLEPSAMREEVALKEVRVLAPNGSDVAAFYNTLQTANPRQFDALAKSLKQVIPSLGAIEVERTDQGFVRLMVDESGMPLSSRLISEGTLRVLGLLAITNPLTSISVVGFEEPENGVHPPRLAMVAKLLSAAADRGQTQFIINTHSPVLPDFFDDLENAVLIRCRKEGRASVFEPFRDPGALFRRNEVEAALEERPTTLGERIVRGDFDQ